MSERKLAEDYIECCAYIPDTPCGRGGRFYVIITPDGHIWPREGAEEKHPECFAPEPKLPEFRKGDLLRVWIYGYRRFVIMSGYSETTGWLQVECADGKIRSVNPTNAQAELIDRPSTSSGPIRVGSYVSYSSITLAKDEIRGIVTGIGDNDSGFYVIWQDGIQGWYRVWQLTHIASPDNHEQ